MIFLFLNKLNIFNYQVNRGFNNFLELRNQMVIKGYKMPESGKVLEINGKKIANKKSNNFEVIICIKPHLLIFL